jgi:signal peptidase II
MKVLAACLVSLALFTALDLWSKQWAVDALSMERPGEPPPVCQPNESGRMPRQRLPEGRITLIDGYLEFRYAENCGAAFSLMEDVSPTLRLIVFGLAAILASAVLLTMFVRGRGGPLFAASVPLIVSGAVGNLVDRVMFGYVVDFIRFHIQNEWEWPTFNIADSTITVGVILLFLDGLFEGRRERAAAEAAGGGEQGSGSSSGSARAAESQAK